MFALLFAEHIGLAFWVQPVYYKQFAHTLARIQSELRLIKADVKPEPARVKDKSRKGSRLRMQCHRNSLFPVDGLYYNM